MDKITFVTPPSGFLLDERVFPSLGILKVAASCEKAGISVEHLDLSGVKDYNGLMHSFIMTRKTFAITATTPQMPAAIKILEVIREKNKKAKVILGGPHVTLVNAASKKANERAKIVLQTLRESFDTLICGDGEKSILLDQGNRIIDSDDPKSDLWQTSQDFDESPYPARHLIDLNSYKYTIDEERATSLIAQLGCPFECGFCGGRSSPMLRRIRLRSSNSVVKELEHLYDVYGYKGFMFYDDELNVNKNVVELMHRVKALSNYKGVDFRLRGFVKAELFDEDQAKAMYEAGFRWLLCGFESAHPKILRNINKKATLSDNTSMLRIAHNVGLKVKALMSFGHPGESEETILATRDWLLLEKPDDFDCTVITTYPGTPYWDGAVKVSDSYKYEYKGDALYSTDVDFNKEEAYYKGVPGDYQSFVWTDYLNAKQLVKLRDDVESEVREKLRIPYQVSSIEHSMGMNQIWRKS